MNKVLIFAGTIEGRNLAQYLTKHQVEVVVCVATEYGEKLIEDDNITISNKRLNVEEMKSLMTNENITCVIDATHPYAVEVSKNIRTACMDMNIELLRLLRKSVEGNDSCVYVDSVEDAVEYIDKTQGNVLLTTGSKELRKYTAIKDYANRLYARVLSTKEVIHECTSLGFEGKHLIAMQGPFLEEFNYALIKQIEAKYIITKESGDAGGFEEKISAAKRAGITAIVIGRPSQESGYPYNECVALLQKKYNITDEKNITLVGIGMGRYENMTLECEKACRQADVIIGATRILDTLKSFQKQMIAEYNSDKIVRYIKENLQYQNIVVALSGDVGFYSGAKKLVESLQEYQPKLLCGISSVVYFASKLQTSWEDIKLVSNHGKKGNTIAAIKRNQKTFILLGGKEDLSQLAQSLIANKLENVKIAVGMNLSYDNEQIIEGNPSDFCGKEFAPLSVVIIENKDAIGTIVTHGIADEQYIRGEVPMTKEEIRSISLSKLQLTNHAIVYDIGAGTGSVSIEMALQAYNGHVYAVEKNEKAIDLIGKNCNKFGVTNISIINQTAPFLNEEMLVPTHAFIGGSSGNMKEILLWLFDKNPNIRIVINTVTLESLSEAMNCIKEFNIPNVDIAQVSVAKSRKLGKYHLMTGLNPVTIVSFSKGVGDETS